MKLSAQFLTKRRHRRCAPDDAVCDVGARFRICFGAPRKIREKTQDGRLQLRVSASVPSAFGSVNLHETTRWSIEALERHYRGGPLLDVGTGAGLLALAAARLAAEAGYRARIDAFDIYNDAVRQARVNLRLNGVAGQVDLRQATLADYPAQTYTVVMANLPPVAINELWPALTEKLTVGGRLILSGILNHNLSRLIDRLGQAGLVIREQVVTELWCLLVAERSNGPGGDR